MFTKESVSETIIGQFFVYYLESIKYSIDLAGSISALFLIIGFLGGIINILKNKGMLGKPL